MGDSIIPINVNDSVEKMAENIRSMYTPDCPHKGFDVYLTLIRDTSKKGYGNLYLAMESHIASGKEFGKELDTKIYNSYKSKYHKPKTVWQKFLNLFK